MALGSMQLTFATTMRNYATILQNQKISAKAAVLVKITRTRFSITITTTPNQKTSNLCKIFVPYLISIQVRFHWVKYHLKIHSLPWRSIPKVAISYTWATALNYSLMTTLVNTLEQQCKRLSSK